jgi:peptidoglycan/LPS O-acetylase OafA/YrhL
VNPPARRRLARVLGSLLGAVWLFILLAHAVGDATGGGDELTLEGLTLGLLAVLALGALVVAFRDERRGGLALVGVGLLLCVFAAWSAGRNQWLAVLVAGVPWLAVGSLFVLVDGDR